MAFHLDAARINARLTQAESAEKLGISRNTLSNYEQYKTMPDVEKGKEIAALYGLTVDDIIWSRES